jgi:hypothetical protein
MPAIPTGMVAVISSQARRWSAVVMRRCRMEVTRPVMIRARSWRKKITRAAAVARWTATRKDRYGELAAVLSRLCAQEPPSRRG